MLTKKTRGQGSKPATYDIWWGLSAIAAAAVAIFYFWFVSNSALVPTATHPSVIETKVDSDQNVVATIYSEDRSLQFLTSGKSVVGAQFLGAEFRDQAAFRGFAVQQSAMFAKPDAKRVLQLGLGAGIVPNYIRQRRLPVDVVEFSKEIVYMAEQHFGYDSCCQSAASNCSDPRYHALCERNFGRTIIQEARQFLFNASDPIAPYDIVISDLFMGSNPGHLYSKQVFQQIKRVWLTPTDGIMVVNFVGLHVGPGSKSAHILAR
jgi:hypothetical protein